MRPTHAIPLVLLPLVVVVGAKLQTAEQDEPPRAMWNTAHPVPESSSCTECHQPQTQGFVHAPHNGTLHLGNDPVVLERFAGKSVRHLDHSFSFELRNEELYLLTDAYPAPVRVDWVFGSGAHAMTPITLLTDDQGKDRLVQLRISWYPDGELRPTLGHAADASLGAGIAALGKLSDHPETLTCFGCHSTRVPSVGGRILAEHVLPNVGCERCHQGAEEHLRFMHDGDGQAAWDMPWTDLTALESVNRCGECHRRANEMRPYDLTTDEPEITRLASVGLTLSPCFKPDALSDDPARMDCLTCHDPHRPASKHEQTYVSACQRCHSTTQGVTTNCSVSPESEACLDCHMPKVEIMPGLRFTDHWIRVRSD